MTQDTRKFVTHCTTCQENKPVNHKKAGLLQPLPQPKRVWEELTMDFITHLPQSLGHTAVWVICDRLSKSVHFLGLPSHYNAPDLARRFMVEIFRHPETDGQTEVVNRSLESYLRCFASDHPRTWFRFLHLAEYWYNTAFHSAIGMSPFQALYGRPPPSLFEYSEDSSISNSINTVTEGRLRSKWVN